MSHISLYHPSQKACGVCGQIFLNTSSLTSHVSRKHTHLLRQIIPTDIPVVLNEVFNSEQLTVSSFIQSTPLPVCEETDKIILNDATVAYLKYAGEKGIPESVVKDILFDMQPQFQRDGVSLSYLQNPRSFDEHLRNNNYPYVAPSSLSINNGVGSVAYVSIKENLCRLLECKGVIEEVLQTNTVWRNAITSGENEKIWDLVHGEYFKQYYENMMTDNVMFLLFYSDEYVIANPLSSKASTNKLFALYFTIANIRMELRSNLQFYGLVLQTKSVYVKEEGLSNILQPFLHEWSILEENGLHIANQHFTIRFLYMPQDNLAAHAIGAFSRSFNSFRSSRFCLASRGELNSVTLGDACTLRTVEQHNIHVARVEADPSFITTYGVSGKSPLADKITNFHPVISLPPDIMHGLLEGIVPLELTEILRAFVRKGLLTWHQINCLIKQFPYVNSDLSDRPSVLAISRKAVKGNSSQNHCFLRLFGLLFHEYIPCDDEHWALWKLLCEVVRFSMALSISHQLLLKFQTLVEEHIKAFIRLFPNINVTPKLHNTLHYPLLLRKYGPLRLLWCMRFEALHERNKRFALTLKNFKNPHFSLSRKFQLHACYQRIAHKPFVNDMITLRRPTAVVELPKTFHNYLVQTSFDFTTPIYRSYALLRNTVLFKRNCCIIIDISSNTLQFANILSFYHVATNFFIYCQHVTTHFDSRLQAYVIQPERRFSIECIQTIPHPLPYPIYTIGSQRYIVPKFILCKKYLYKTYEFS
jgi:hypothetical protein